MKKQLAIALFGALTLAAVPAMSETVREETTTEKTTTFKGTLSEFPDSHTIVLKGDTGSPARYTFNEKTTFVDENGNVVSRETIRNQPVTIYTAPDAGSTVVSKVVVSRSGGDTTTRKETTVEERR
jgi:hypothetical protein